LNYINKLRLDVYFSNIYHNKNEDKTMSMRVQFSSLKTSFKKLYKNFKDKDQEHKHSYKNIT